MHILLGIAALLRRLDGPADVEDGAVDVEDLLVLLGLVGVLEERPHHPRVGEDAVELRHRLLVGHGYAPGCGLLGAAWLAAGFGACWLSASSLENSTSAAPAPTSTMPTHSFQPGISRWKWNGSPFCGCQTTLTSVLITGARPKIR